MTVRESGFHKKKEIRGHILTIKHTIFSRIIVYITTLS
jgi:hypothetical protein